MRSSKLLFTLTVLLFTTSVFGASFLPKDKFSLSITYTWPVYGVPQSFNQYEKYTKEDFPCFNGDNFALTNFGPFSFTQEQWDRCLDLSSKVKPLNMGNIQKSDLKYLEKYIYRFEQNDHQTTQDLWNLGGACFNKGEKEYFSTMVQVHKKFNIIQALAAKNIVPHKTKLYKTEDIQNAIAAILGGIKPTLFCTTSFDFDKRPSYFKSFSIMIDSKLNPTSDTENWTNVGMCKGEINFPPLEF